MDDELRPLLRRLAAVAPDEFVAARNELVKQLGAAGDREAANSVKQLRRPTWIDHALDLAAERHVDLTAAFLDAAATTREVQAAAVAGTRTGSLPEALRTLRAAQGSLASATDRLLVEAGRPSDLAGVNTRLAVVAADADESGLLHEGLLAVAAQAGEASGADTETTVRARATSSAAKSRAPRAQPVPDAEQAAALRSQRDDARRERQDVQRAVVAAAKAIRQARTRHDRAVKAVEVAAEAVRAAEAALAEAQRAATATGTSLDRAESAADQLEARAAEIDSQIARIDAEIEST